MIVTVKNEVDRARGQAARSPEQGLAGALQGQYKRQDKNRFFRAENLGYTNNRPPLSSTHRSVSPSGELSNGDGSPVRFFISTAGHRILSVFISTTEHGVTRAFRCTRAVQDSLRLKHRSWARTDPFRFHGSFPMGTDLLFVFLYLLLSMESLEPSGTPIALELRASFSARRETSTPVIYLFIFSRFRVPQVCTELK